MKKAFILPPNTLFQHTAPLKQCDIIYLIEELLFFKLYKFHKQKLVFHRASMKAFDSYLKQNGFQVNYVNATDKAGDIRCLIPGLKSKGISTIMMYDPCDDWLEKRIRNACLKSGISIEFIENPMFINSQTQLNAYQSNRKKYFQTDFYIHQRKTRDILVNEDSTPFGGKWSFDDENRARYPKGQKPPQLKEKYLSVYHKEAAVYVESSFPDNYGEINPEYYYPVTHEQSETALTEFLQSRFSEFGIYEDAIIAEESYLHHSVLSGLLNVGLLLPMYVIDRAIDHAAKHNIPFNSLEGFVRQVLGWREFVRMVYIREGKRQRTCNYWQFKRKIPASFYDGTTGITPIDSTIKKLKQSAYNHHIERLMLLSNFMLLCEFDPDEVYRWFMEMYIDAYDWVMVPNVYGMGQFSDGGLMCTKPYISGSNYIFKMSNYKKTEEWAEVWDALFWRFMHVHRSFFLKNPRLGMLIKT
ncbi:MAG: cryptochrome/photolyase family protein, partial [Chitinophagaceae bacterium]|nr:cryptochrome/photolyase family protein [Chitinophagaceae bacterium]